MFGLSDLLSVENGEYVGSDMERGNSLVNLIQRMDPDIVVVTTGAHYPEVNLFESSMREVIGGIKRMEKARVEAVAVDETSPTSEPHAPRKKIQFAWKSQNPGHPSCMNKGYPDTNRAAAMEEVETVDPAADRYFWRIYPQFDRIVQEMIRDSPIAYLDMSPLYMRADSHQGAFDPANDCLHFCLPGPVDLFSIHMMHYLSKQGGYAIHSETPTNDVLTV